MNLQYQVYNIFLRHHFLCIIKIHTLYIKAKSWEDYDWIFLKILERIQFQFCIAQQLVNVTPFTSPFYFRQTKRNKAESSHMYLEKLPASFFQSPQGKRFLMRKRETHQDFLRKCRKHTYVLHISTQQISLYGLLTYELKIRRLSLLYKVVQPFSV